jgi:Flp pilus assembly pilin Flp
MRFGTRATAGRREKDRSRSRGATAVEYALGISFLAVASLGAISSLEDDSSQALVDKGDAIGAPDVNEVFGSSTSTSAATSTSSTTSTTAPPAPPVAVITSSLSSHSGNNCSGNKWTPTVIVLVTDDQVTPAPVFKATVAATWVQTSPSGTITSTASFATKQDGTATFSLHNLEANDSDPLYVSSVTFTINSVTPEGGSAFVPNPPLSVTINEVQAPCT